MDIFEQAYENLSQDEKDYCDNTGDYSLVGYEAASIEESGY